MTSEISILNKTAIVLAGDSAVTIGDGKKIYNTANKIFQLTEEGTIGIMIYNQSNWMGIPLETIIKSYYKDNGKKTYKTLEEYSNSFFAYMKSNIYKYVSDFDQKELIIAKTHEHIEALKYLAEEILDDKIRSKKITISDDNHEYQTEIVREIEEVLDNLFVGIDKFSNIIEDFNDFSLEEFKKSYNKEIFTILNGFSTYNDLKISKKVKDKFVQFVFKDIVSGISEEENFTGIVIAGFGEDEIFPSVQDFKLGELFENRLRFEKGKMTEIDNDTVAIIRPFAQRDMIDTFMQGIEPNLLSKIREIIDSEFESLILQINSKFNISKTKLNTLFDKANTEIGNKIHDYRSSRHIDPTITTVSYLNKEGLIELAESLVSITSLKRKTSSDLETVGGPVDIAIITKGDGFKWVKNKDN